MSSEEEKSQSSQPEASLRTCFTVTSTFSVHLKVSAIDASPESGSKDLCKGADGLGSAIQGKTAGHHLVITGNILSPEGSSLHLDDRGLRGIIDPMLEDINALRDGWLNISELHARPSAAEMSGDATNTTATVSYLPISQHAVKVTLVPAIVPSDGDVDRRLHVALEWIDSRAERTESLADLLSSLVLPLHLRDLVSQMTSRLLIDILLGDPETAKLYHHSWQQRQRETAPLIDSIAVSIRSLIANASKDAELDALLQQVDPGHELPSVIALSNILTRIDLAAHPPTMRRPSTARAKRKLTDTTDELHASFVELAADGGDSDCSWIDDEAEPNAIKIQDDESPGGFSDLLFAPDEDDADPFLMEMLGF